jgi:PAS domain S-box-containing protein
MAGRETSLPPTWRGTQLELAGLAGALLEQAAATVISVDPEGSITSWNPEAERAFGWTREEVAGRPLAELLAGGETDPVAAALAGQRWEGPLGLRSKEGAHVAVWATAAPLRVPDGSTVGAVLVGVRTGELRRPWHEQLETVLGGLEDAITMRSADGRLVYANEPAARALGFGTVDELLAASSEGVRGRFDILGDDGRPLPPEELPGRLALTTGEAVERVVRFRVRDSGEDRWALVRATPVRDEHGAATDSISMFRDITERRRAEDALRFLADAGSLLGHSLDWESTLGGVARLAVPAFADWCIVDVVETGQQLRRVAVAAADARDQELLEQLRRDYSPGSDSPQPAARALRSGRFIIDEFSPEALADSVVDERHLELMQELNPRSAIALPLVVEDETLGAITFASSRSARRYTEADLPFAEELARRAAAAVANARLYRAERQARERLDFLAEASQVLAGSLDYERTLDRVARLLVPRLADWCVIDVLEDDAVRRVAVVCADPARQALADELRDSYPEHPVAAGGTSQVLQSGTGELIPVVTDEWIEAIAPTPRQYEILRSLGLRSNILVPLEARGRALGVLTVATAESGRSFGPDELAVAEDLARRAALAVDNARLFHEAEARGEAARALAYVADGVVLLDEDGVVRFWNPAAEAITGFTAGEVLGRPAAEAIPGWRELAERVPIGPGPGAATRPKTLPLERAGREVWLSISAVGFGEGTVYAFRDLTEERALERLRSDFVSTVSHELRTPLAAIYGAALTLDRSDVQLPEEQRKTLLGVIAAEADRLARTINDILWASRLDSGTLQVAISSCDGAELARSVADSFRTHIPPDVTLETRAAADLPPVAGDPDKVRQVLSNLVDNAVKYSPDGGVVEVAVEPRGTTVRFSVCDEGLGVPAEEQRRIFEKFYRLDPNLTRGVGGTGLGLYICQELVRHMDGRIWVESRAGGGSTFSFELPATL